MATKFESIKTQQKVLINGKCLPSPGNLQISQCKKKKKNHNVFIASYYKNICEKKNTNGPLFKQLFLKPDN